MPGCILRIEASPEIVAEMQRVFGNAARSGVMVSVASGDHLKEQIADVCAFLDRHERELERFSKQCRSLTLDFGVFRRDVPAEYKRFPAELVARAGRFKMSLEISQYSAE